MRQVVLDVVEVGADRVAFDAERARELLEPLREERVREVVEERVLPALGIR